MANSSIEWTDKVWNPVTGCTKISAGCANCYAATFAHRGMGHWKGRKFEDVQIHNDRLSQPFRWAGKKVFVNSMSDLFHEKVSDDFIALVFNSMASGTLECKGNHAKHMAREDYGEGCWTGEPATFQILTKRPERMLSFMTKGIHQVIDDSWRGDCPLSLAMECGEWPLKNVWLGVSVENQKTAEERILPLLKTPSRIRFLSVEPMLEKIDLIEVFKKISPISLPIEGSLKPLIDWVICGGESGPGARPFNIEWARDLRDQCVAMDIPFFMKQMGAKPYFWRNGDNISPVNIHIGERMFKSAKGGEMTEWPEDLRIREFPKC